MIEMYPATTCKDCGNSFRYNPGNSSIKPVRCVKCQNILDSKKRIEKNNKLLAQSSFVVKNKRSEGRAIKYTASKKEAVKPKKTPKDRARSLADMWFSKYIRLNYSFEANGELFCRCYTCGIIKHIKDIENGHWQRRGFLNTRYNTDNCRPQCTKCNCFKSGEPERFEIHLIKEIGQDRVNELKVLSQQNFFDDNYIFFKDQADKFRLLTNELMERIGIKPWVK